MKKYWKFFSSINPQWVGFALGYIPFLVVGALLPMVVGFPSELALVFGPIGMFVGLLSAISYDQGL